jgi:hypothetical protein
MDYWGTTDTATTGAGGVDFSATIDMRVEMHKVLFGGVDMPPQGQYVVLREFNDVPCPACWDPNGGGTRRSNCSFCQGESYQFTERIVTAGIFAGVAPVYKPAILGSGQYPLAAYGDTDPNRYTGYVEWNVYLNYERYTLPQALTPDKLYQLKVNGDGSLATDGTGQPIRSAKWKILSTTPIRGDNATVAYFELGLIKENVS